ncbi:hypothetical protein QFC20_002308 [Naganishia adeliensis]|uniref:Uncharacterized protein n=1 Tax=Naganishia adeliensis TaxID=92952 RepID=A0ACC2WNL4_9TREE|nr:hypothetical protein QFC20_002308 [Naganishia adeliensis]
MFAKLAIASLLPALALGQYSATYYPDNLPQTTEEGQYGTNQCGTGNSQTSNCQNAYLNGIDDFCLFAPPGTTSSYGDSSLGNTERIVVSWCLKSGYGTRLIPSGAITGAHFVKTPTYIQLSGTGDLTKLNIPASMSLQYHEFMVGGLLTILSRLDDDGGELDPHGADGLGNPIGGLKQIHEWNSFIGAGYFCFKACNQVEGADLQCQHIMPGEYGQGFSSCQGDAAEYPGVYGGSTFHQGDSSTPAPHAPAATSQCSYLDSLPYNGAAAVVTAAVSFTTTSSGSASGMSSTGSASNTASASNSGSTSGASSSSASSSSSSSSSQSSGSSAAASATSMATIARSSAAGTTGVASQVQSAAASAAAPTSGASQNAVVGFTMAVVCVFGVALSAF